MDMYPDVDPTTTQVSFRALREQLLDAKATVHERRYCKGYLIFPNFSPS